MSLDGMFLMANGHKISIDVPDGWHLGWKNFIIINLYL